MAPSSSLCRWPAHLRVAASPPPGPWLAKQAEQPANEILTEVFYRSAARASAKTLGTKGSAFSAFTACKPVDANRFAAPNSNCAPEPSISGWSPFDQSVFQSPQTMGSNSPPMTDPMDERIRSSLAALGPSPIR
jgi:hypothetical protein